MQEKKSILSLFPEFPIEIGMPERVIFYNKKKCLDFINNLNGKKRLFYSLYSLNNIKLNKIWFDLDSDNSYNNTKKLHDWCNNNNYKHSIIFSGGGFHFYIYTKNYNNIIEPQNALKAMHHVIANELNLSIGDPKVCDLDEHCIGDIKRIATIPSTFNLKRNLFAISLTEEEFNSGLNNIKELAKTQRQQLYIFCSDYFDASNYKDIKVDYSSIKFEEYKNDLILPKEDEKILNLFPPCVQQVLLNVDRKGHFKGRYLFAIWSKELGLNEQDCDKIAKKFFSKVQRTDGMGTNYDHFKKVKVCKYVYQHDDLPPSCEKVFVEYGLCPGKCNMYLIKKFLSINK